MAFYSEKGWWKSKTVWTGIVGAVLGVLALFGWVPPIGIDPETIVGIILTIVSVLAAIFRVNATEAVTLKSPTTPQIK